MAQKPWEVIAWTPEHQQTIYRDWGINYSFKQQYEKASTYYTKSLDIKDDDVRALLNRSLCKDDIAHCESALEDAIAGLVLSDMNHPLNVQMCDALYHLNEFEKNKVELANKWRKFKWKQENYHGIKVKPATFVGHKEEPFLHRLDIVDQNFLDTLGVNVGIFLKKNSKILDKVVEEMNRRKMVDPRPLWKILKEKEECDVVSELMTQVKKLHIREQARLDQYFRVFLQLYFLKGWIDVATLKKLMTNKKLLLPQTRKSTPLLAELTKTQYEAVFKFLKMLQARSPLYTKRYKMCPNQKLAAKIREDHLFRVQYQTRRDMFNILENVKKLRAAGNIEKLAEYVENAMGNYVETKTLRVLPRKFEFTNEIYNILGLAYLDQMQVPPELMFGGTPDERLATLMNIPKEKDRDSEVKYVFGDKSTYQEPDAPDYVYLAYKKRTTRLENRIPWAKYSIDKCYLYHEIAKNHLTQSKFDEARTLGRKVMEEADLCKNHLWKFLGAMIICKSNVMQRKLEQVSLSLETAKEVAKKLNSPQIQFFMETCINMNQMWVDIKQTVSEEFEFTKETPDEEVAEESTEATESESLDD